MATFANSLVVLQNVKGSYHMAQRFKPTYISRGIENVCPLKNQYTSVQAVFFLTTSNGNNSNVHQKTIGKQMWFIHTTEYYSVIKRNGILKYG